MTIHELIPQASDKIGAIAKGQRNKEQNYSFRGLDDVLARVAPVFSELGISVVPKVLSVEYAPVEARSGAKGWRATLRASFRFYGPEGDYVETTTIGESIDYGDKSSNKAMSAAHKYALTMTLSLPTYEVDPDAETPEGAPVSKADAAKEKSPYGEKPKPKDDTPASGPVSALRNLVAGGLVSESQLLVWARKAAKSVGEDQPRTLDEVWGLTPAAFSVLEALAEEATA